MPVRKKKTTKKGRRKAVKSIGPKRAMYPVGNMGRGGPYYITQEAPKVDLPKELLDVIIEKTGKTAKAGSNLRSIAGSIWGGTRDILLAGQALYPLGVSAYEYTYPEEAAAARTEKAKRKAEEEAKTTVKEAYGTVKGGVEGVQETIKDIYEQKRGPLPGLEELSPELIKDIKTATTYAGSRGGVQKQEEAVERIKGYGKPKTAFTPIVNGTSPNLKYYQEPPLKGAEWIPPGEPDSDAIKAVYGGRMSDANWLQAASLSGAMAFGGYAVKRGLLGGGA